MNKLTLLLTLLAFGSLEAVRYPIEPISPKIPNGGQSNKTQPAKKKKKVEQIAHRVSVMLGSKDVLNGTIQANRVITFQHYRSGLLFTKTVSPADIKTLRVRKYKYRLLGKKSKNKTYEFLPAEIELTLSNNRKYYLTKMFSFLNRFKINTIDGDTTLFTYFADTWVPKKGWSEVTSREFNYHQQKAHPQAVVEINFSPESRAGAN